jgi:hypothetical protein
MSKIYFTLTGTNHYFGKEFLKKGTKIRLEKEPDNEYDKEAIKVIYEGLGKIGFHFFLIAFTKPSTAFAPASIAWFFSSLATF